MRVPQGMMWKYGKETVYRLIESSKMAHTTPYQGNQWHKVTIF